ncbi:hypothetical protein [Macrococcus sp. DPC7161]|uniref:hypothetical protein n=1 Tax=Macrococcus sp. DPC7161 TaxID=2507060 RepID=UPI0013E910BC|nr:hypothetical protein [Macrococcus sp. DPC7161]
MKTATILFVALSFLFQLCFTVEESYGTALVIAGVTALFRINSKEYLKKVK